MLEVCKSRCGLLASNIQCAQFKQLFPSWKSVNRTIIEMFIIILNNYAQNFISVCSDEIQHWCMHLCVKSEWIRIKNTRDNSSNFQFAFSQNVSKLSYKVLAVNPRNNDNRKRITNTQTHTHPHTPRQNCRPPRETCKSPGQNCRPPREISKSPGKKCSHQEVSTSPGENCRPAREANKLPGENCRPAREASKLPGENCGPARDANKLPGKYCRPAREVSKVPGQGQQWNTSGLEGDSAQII